MKLTIDTFEDGSTVPVLTHVFYGASAADVQAVLNAHLHTDSFFKAAMTTGRFRGMILTNRQLWSP